jgi:hypothetical protein
MQILDKGERYFSELFIGRWSSHEASNNNVLKATDFAITTYFPAKKMQEEIW